MDNSRTFLKLLEAHRLLQPDQLEALTPDVLARYSDPRALAKYLMQRGWLTVYQVNQLFQGNPQELVIGPYRILDSLGEGGVSHVYKAWDTRRKCVAALKTIKPEHLSNVEALGRFKREMRVIAQLSHPNVVRAFDVDLDNPRHYFAMEYVEGTDLGKMIKLSGPLPVPRACGYVRQAALGLQHAHELGLVHRDIKPGNLLVTVGGSVVKILDLGMARLRQTGAPEQSMSRLTLEGVMIGTPDYLAPEQAKDPRSVDIRADIYGLGCTLYYILAGEPPFSGHSVLEKLFKHQTVEANFKSLHHVSYGLTSIIQKMLAKRPEDRPQTPAEVAEALTPYCAGPNPSGG